MKISLRYFALAGVVVAAATAAATTIAPPPITPTDKNVDVVQGVHIADPYRWLENPDDPKVGVWSDAQNARTRGYLDSLSDRAPVKAELTRLIKATSPSYSQLSARGSHIFALYNDPAKQQPMLVMLNAAANPAAVAMAPACRFSCYRPMRARTLSIIV